LTRQKLWTPIIAIALAFATVGVAGVMVYRMWQQAIEPVHTATHAVLLHPHQ
jgi:hypothetical protein